MFLQQYHVLCMHLRVLSCCSMIRSPVSVLPRWGMLRLQIHVVCVNNVLSSSHELVEACFCIMSAPTSCSGCHVLCMNLSVLRGSMLRSHVSVFPRMIMRRSQIHVLCMRIAHDVALVFVLKHARVSCLCRLTLEHAPAALRASSCVAFMLALNHAFDTCLCPAALEHAPAARPCALSPHASCVALVFELKHDRVSCVCRPALEHAPASIPCVMHASYSCCPVCCSMLQSQTYWYYWLLVNRVHTLALSLSRFFVLWRHCPHGVGCGLAPYRMPIRSSVLHAMARRLTMCGVGMAPPLIHHQRFRRCRRP